jgi:hypothetical protein
MTASPATRIVVLPDDTMVLELVDRAGQLLEVLTACERDAAEDPDEPRPWRLPAPIADGLATSATSRIASAVHTHLTPAGVPTPRRPRLLAPDRAYEHRPLRRVPLRADDTEILAEAARVCHQALAEPSPTAPEQRLLLDNLRELLDNIDANPAFDTRVGAVPALAALAALAALIVEPDPDLARLAGLLTEAGETDLVLTPEAEQTYQHVADRMNTTLSGGDPLERWAW